MNNLDLSLEFLKKCQKTIKTGVPVDNAILAALQDLAEWKDEQFSKFLLWLDDNYVIRRFTDGEHMTYEKLIDAFKNMDK